MATVKIPAEQRTLTDQAEVTAYLAKLGIDYERWPLSQRAAANALRIGPRAVAFEANDRNIGRAADRSHDELAEPVAQQARALAEAAGDVGARLHLHLATHPVRRAHHPDDGVVGANRSRG